MTGKGSITTGSNRQLKLLLFAQAFWLVVVFLIGAWWSRLVLKQASRIRDLEEKLGIAEGASHMTWERTQRMLYWESGVYFLLLLASTGLILWIYWRDIKRSKSLHAFFASVTHELKTPLTSIRLQAESIAEEVPGKAKELIRRLLEDTSRLEGQVERTLELARVEGGGPIYTRVTSVKPAIDRIVSSWREAWSHRAEFKTDIDDLAIDADLSALQVIFKNLFENTLRHNVQDKLEVFVSVKPSVPGRVCIIYSDGGESNEIEAEQIGELFQKGRKSGGAGVGLYLVKVLMSRMVGEAKFKGGKGFPVYLYFREGRTHV